MYLILWMTGGENEPARGYDFSTQETKEKAEKHLEWLDLVAGGDVFETVQVFKAESIDVTREVTIMLQDE